LGFIVVCGDCREVGAGLLDSGAPEAWSSTLCTREKYNSRTPQLYSEELSQAAALATRIQEDKIHIGTCGRRKSLSIEERKKAQFPEVDAVATLSLRDCDQLGGAGSGHGQHDACCLLCFLCAFKLMELA